MQDHPWRHGGVRRLQGSTRSTTKLSRSRRGGLLVAREQWHRPALRMDNHFPVVFGSRRTTLSGVYFPAAPATSSLAGALRWTRLLRAASPSIRHVVASSGCRLHRAVIGRRVLSRRVFGTLHQANHLAA